MADFKALHVWQLSRRLSAAVYRATRAFPDDERFGLSRQLRRASTSVCANIAEGCGRKRDPELRRFLSIARGSVQEVESHVLVAHTLGFIPSEEAAELVRTARSVSRMLNAMMLKCATR